MSLSYAPTVFKGLQGVFCVYKPPDFTIGRLLYHIRNSLARELNKMNVRPMRRRFYPDNNQIDKDGLPMIIDVPDISDHTLGKI